MRVEDETSLPGGRPAEQLLAYENVAKQYEEQKKYTQALAYAEDLIYRIYKKEGSPKAAVPYVSSAVYRSNKNSMELLQAGKPKSSLRLLHRAEKLLGEFKCKELAFLTNLTYNNLACVHKRRGRLVSALKALEKGTAVCVEFNERENVSITHLNICAILSQLGNHSAAAEEAKKAAFQCQEDFDRISLQLRANPNSAKLARDKLEKTSLLAISYYNMGVQLEFLKNIREARDWYQKASRTVEGNLEIDLRLKASFYAALKQAERKCQKLDRHMRKRMFVGSFQQVPGLATITTTGGNRTPAAMRQRVRPVSATQRVLSTLPPSKRIRLAQKFQASRGRGNKTTIGSWDMSSTPMMSTEAYSRTGFNHALQMASGNKRSASITPSPILPADPSNTTMLKSVVGALDSSLNTISKNARNLKNQTVRYTDVLRQERCVKAEKGAAKPGGLLDNEVDKHLVRKLSRSGLLDEQVAEFVPSAIELLDEDARKDNEENHDSDRSEELSEDDEIEEDSAGEQEALRRQGKLEWDDPQEVKMGKRPVLAEEEKPSPSDNSDKSYISRVMRRDDEFPGAVLIPEENKEILPPQETYYSGEHDVISVLAGHGRRDEDEQKEEESASEEELGPEIVETPAHVSRKARESAARLGSNENAVGSQSPPVVTKVVEVVVAPTESVVEEVKVETEPAAPVVEEKKQSESVVEVKTHRLDRNSAAQIIQRVYRVHVAKYILATAKLRKKVPWQTCFRGLYRTTDYTDRSSILIIQYSHRDSKVRIRTVDTHTKSQLYFIEHEIPRVLVQPLPTLRAAWENVASRATGNIAEDALDYIEFLHNVLKPEADEEKVLPAIAFFQNRPDSPTPKPRSEVEPAAKEVEVKLEQEASDDNGAKENTLSRVTPEEASEGVEPPVDNRVQDQSTLKPSESVSRQDDVAIIPTTGEQPPNNVTYSDNEEPAQAQVIRIESCKVLFTHQGEKLECHLRISFWYDAGRNVTSVRCHDYDTDTACEPAFEILGRDDQALKKVMEFVFVREQGKQRVLDVRVTNSLKDVVRPLSDGKGGNRELIVVPSQDNKEWEKRLTALTEEEGATRIQRAYKRFIGNKHDKGSPFKNVFGKRIYLDDIRVGSASYTMTVRTAGPGKGTQIELRNVSKGTTQTFSARSFDFAKSTTEEFERWLNTVRSAAKPSGSAVRIVSPEVIEETGSSDRRGEDTSRPERIASGVDLEKEISGSFLSSLEEEQRGSPTKRAFTFTADSAGQKGGTGSKAEEGLKCGETLRLKTMKTAGQRDELDMIVETHSEKAGNEAKGASVAVTNFSAGKDPAQEKLQEDARNISQIEEAVPAKEESPVVNNGTVQEETKHDQGNVFLDDTLSIRSSSAHRQSEDTGGKLPELPSSFKVDDSALQLVEEPRSHTPEEPVLPRETQVIESLRVPENNNNVLAEAPVDEDSVDAPNMIAAGEETGNSVVKTVTSAKKKSNVLFYECNKIIDGKKVGVRLMPDAEGKVREAYLKPVDTAPKRVPIPPKLADYLSSRRHTISRKRGICRIMSDGLHYNSSRFSFDPETVKECERLVDLERLNEAIARVQGLYRRRKAVARRLELTIAQQKGREVLFQEGIRLGDDYHLVRVTLSNADRNTLLIRSNRARNKVTILLTNIMREDLWQRIKDNSYEISRILRANLTRIVAFEHNTELISFTPKSTATKKQEVQKSYNV